MLMLQTQGVSLVPWRRKPSCSRKQRLLPGGVRNRGLRASTPSHADAGAGGESFPRQLEQPGQRPGGRAATGQSQQDAVDPEQAERARGEGRGGRDSTRSGRAGCGGRGATVRPPACILGETGPREGCSNEPAVTYAVTTGLSGTGRRTARGAAGRGQSGGGGGVASRRLGGGPGAVQGSAWSEEAATVVAFCTWVSAELAGFG